MTTAAPSLYDQLNKVRANQESSIRRLDMAIQLMVDMLGNLRARWADESQYESVSEYLEVITKTLKEHFPEAENVRSLRWRVSFKLPCFRYRHEFYIVGSRGGWKAMPT